MKVLGLLVFYCLEGVPFDIIYCYGYVVGIIYFIGYSFDMGNCGDRQMFMYPLV